MELRNPAAQRECEQRSRTEKLELYKAVGPDTGCDIRSLATQKRKRSIGHHEHRQRKENRAQAMKVFTGRRPQNVKLLLHRNAPERCRNGFAETMLRHIPVTPRQKKCKQA